MNSKTFSSEFLFLLYFLVLITTTTSSKQLKIPRLSPTGPLILRDPEIATSDVSEDLETFNYTQTLDHFNYRPESYDTFQQRYVLNSKYWGGANVSAPIFAYLGAEQSLDNDLIVVGFLNDNAASFKALLLYIEHRYYGKSIPFGSREDALKNASTLGYFNSAQAIADYAEIILHVKKELKAGSSPVIVIGGSYGGKKNLLGVLVGSISQHGQILVLASWMRLKYPHIVIGALASSAPVLYFDDITPEDGYYSIVTKVFKETSESCYQTINKSWSVIDEVASETNGLSVLSKKFKTCKPLNNSSELKDYLDSMFSAAAQYNSPSSNPVNGVCSGIDGNAFGNDTISKIFGGVVAYEGSSSCYVNPPTPESETATGWRWQTCTEVVFPIGRGNDTMFPPYLFNITSYSDDCMNKYGVPPRPHWVTTFYGGHSIKLVLHRFGSNIIFSNGLRDPYSSGGVLESISDSIIAVNTINGSHCLDILSASSSDPEWLVMQRKTEVNTINVWISEYYSDIHKDKP